MTDTQSTAPPKTAQHTPGPWYMDGYDLGHYEFAVYGGERNAYIARLEDDGGDTAEQVEANARLIAAAPDLLAALRHFVAPFGHTFSPDGCSACDAAWTAFKKAEGR